MSGYAQDRLLVRFPLPGQRAQGNVIIAFDAVFLVVHPQVAVVDAAAHLAEAAAIPAAYGAQCIQLGARYRVERFHQRACQCGILLAHAVLGIKPEIKIAGVFEICIGRGGAERVRQQVRIVFSGYSALVRHLVAYYERQHERRQKFIHLRLARKRIIIPLYAQVLHEISVQRRLGI